MRTNMHNPEYVLENDMHRFRWDFDIQTDHLISARWTYNNQQKERTCRIEDFVVPADHRVKLKECKKRD